LILSSGGLNSQSLQCDTAASAAQPLLFHGSDRAFLLQSFRTALSSSQQFRQASGCDEALWSELIGGGRPSDLPMVAEEEDSSDDGDGGGAGHGADAKDCVEFSGDRVADSMAYSCEHCHCSVCKRSLEQHQCQLQQRRHHQHSRNSSFSSADRNVFDTAPAVSDDAGGNVNNKTVIMVTILILIYVM